MCLSATGLLLHYLLVRNPEYKVVSKWNEMSERVWVIMQANFIVPISSDCWHINKICKEAIIRSPGVFYAQIRLIWLFFRF